MDRPNLLGRRTLLLQALALLVAGGSDVAGQTPRRAGPLAVEPLNAPPVSLDQLGGSVVGVLLAYPEDCPACDAAMEAAERVYAEHRADGLEILLLAYLPLGFSEGHWREAIRRKIEQSGIAAPMGETTAAQFQAFSGTALRPGVQLPHLTIVDRAGKIQEEHPSETRRSGGDFWSDPEANMRASFRRWLQVDPGDSGSGPPLLSAGAVVDAASFTPASEPDGAPAPGAIVSLFGSRFADRLFVADAAPLPTSLGGVSVTVDGTAVPLFFVSATQINAQLPYELVGAGDRGTVAIAVSSAAGVSETRTLTVAGTSPSLFTLDQSGGGQAIAVFAGAGDLAAPPGRTVNSRPARPGDWITLFANGLGDVTPTIRPGTNSCDPDGVCAPDFSNLTLRHVLVEPAIEIGGVPLPRENVTFAGLAPQFVGLYQINLTVPEGVPSGPAVPIVVRQLQSSSRSDATIAIAETSGPSPTPPGDPEDGRGLFATNCAVCHHADSRERKIGPGLLGLSLGTLPSGRLATLRNIREQIDEGGGGMPAFRRLLTEDEKDDLIAYLLTL